MTSRESDTGDSEEYPDGDVSYRSVAKSMLVENSETVLYIFAAVMVAAFLASVAVSLSVVFSHDFIDRGASPGEGVNGPGFPEENETDVSFPVTFVQGEATVVDGETVRFNTTDGTRNITSTAVQMPGEVNGSVVRWNESGLENTSATRRCVRSWGAAAEDRSNRFVESKDGVYGVIVENSSSSGEWVSEFSMVVSENKTVRLGSVLIAEGYVVVADDRFTDRDAYLDVQASAKRNDTGLWGCPENQPPVGTAGG